MEGDLREEAGDGQDTQAMGAGAGTVEETPQKAGGRYGGGSWAYALDGGAVGRVSRSDRKEPRYR